jgi:hypothetical protein
MKPGAHGTCAANGEAQRTIAIAAIRMRVNVEVPER